MGNRIRKYRRPDKDNPAPSNKWRKLERKLRNANQRVNAYRRSKGLPPIALKLPPKPQDSGTKSSGFAFESSRRSFW